MLALTYVLSFIEINEINEIKNKIYFKTIKKSIKINLLLPNWDIQNKFGKRKQNNVLQVQ